MRPPRSTGLTRALPVGPLGSPKEGYILTISFDIGVAKRLFLGVRAYQKRKRSRGPLRYQGKPPLRLGTPMPIGTLLWLIAQIIVFLISQHNGGGSCA